MIHRILILIAVACLLGACSGDETPAGGGPREQARTAAVPESGESPGVTDDAVGGPSGEPADSAAYDDTSADTAGVELMADAAETLEAPMDSAHPEQMEPEGETDLSAEPGVTASSSGLRVLRAYVCKGIEQSEPTEAGKSFIPEDGVVRLCCFSEIAGAAGPDTVFHVWLWGDREMARVPLEVKSARWRTWSTKRILDEWRGEWHVDVTDGDGVTLTRLEFAVE